MSFDEFLFEIFSFYAKNKQKRRRKSLQKAVKLDDLRDKLTVIARAITGKAIDIHPAEREGGYKNNHFFLPQYALIFEEEDFNIRYYLFRTLYLSIQYGLEHHYLPEEAFPGTEKARADALKHAPEVLEIMFRDFPSMRDFHDLLIERLKQTTKPGEKTDYSWAYGKWMQSQPEGEPVSGNSVNEKIKAAINAEIQNMLKAKAVEEMKVQQVDRKQQEDQVVHNYFEKIETLEEHTGGVWHDFDGDDELEEHADALEELQLSHTVRVDDETHAVLQSDFLENITVAESAETQAKEFVLTYDEWDYKRQAYKKDWCKLYVRRLNESDVNYYRNTLKQHAVTLESLRKILANLNNRYTERYRQPDGDEFDLDAVTDYLTDFLSGRSPSEKIYLSKQKRLKDMAILLLLDASLSSDGYAAGNRIIDVEKQVSILFGEILNEYRVDFSVGAFYSKTRNFSHFVELKSFDESWDKAKFRIGAMQPHGYTRIGTAIRHAGNLLVNRSARNKWLILLSDGKPNDYDRYEGRYGIADVKQALRELKSMNVHSYALAIEAQAKYYLPQMFGVNRFKILTTPVELIKSMVELFEKIRMG